MEESWWPRQEQQGFYLQQQQTLIQPRVSDPQSLLSFPSKQLRSFSLPKQPRPRLKMLMLDRPKDYSRVDHRYRSDIEPSSTNQNGSNSSNLNETRYKIPTKRKVIRDDIELELEEQYVNWLRQVTKQKEVCYEMPGMKTTHGYLGAVAGNSKRSFLGSRLNAEIRGKVMRKMQQQQQGEVQKEQASNAPLTFNGVFQSGNLALALQVTPTQYDLYVRIDTNTKGHQNWYSFKVTSTLPQKQTIKFNICNLQRQFSLYSKGLKPFISVSPTFNWHPSGQSVTYTQHLLDSRKHFKLSFRLELKPMTQYHISMLPLYTYTQLLQYLQSLQQKNKIKLEVLGYSLVGLAIPLVTIENRNSGTISEEKNVVLVSGRVHPGETVGSYIGHGIIEYLCGLQEEVLGNTVWKIVPMMNPDGVVFGNFRTSVLGVDLNRSFHHEQQLLYPQVTSLKRLGYQLKQKHKSKFTYFLDLHGHSTKKNIFVYGPQYSITMRQYQLSRLLPKLIESHCKAFKYSSCSFKLEEGKFNTARGFFLRSLRVMAYTLESSYGLVDEGGETKLMQVADWLGCGVGVVEGIMGYLGCRLEEGGSNKQENKGRGKDQKEKEGMTAQKHRQKLLKSLKASLFPTSPQPPKTTTTTNSDSQDSDQDLPPKDRLKLQKKLILSLLPPVTYLPRVQKPSVLYPMGTPDLSGEAKRDEIRLKLIQHRKGSYMRITPAKRESIIKHLEKLAMLEPNVRALKISFRD